MIQRQKLGAIIGMLHILETYHLSRYLYLENYFFII